MEEIEFENKIKKILGGSIYDYTGLDKEYFPKFFSEEAMDIWKTVFTHSTYSEYNYDVHSWFGSEILKKIIVLMIYELNPNYSEAQLTTLNMDFSVDKTFQDMALKYQFDKLVRINNVSHFYIENVIVLKVMKSFFGGLYDVGELISPGYGNVITKNVGENMFKEELMKENDGRLVPMKTFIVQSIKHFAGKQKIEFVNFNKNNELSDQKKGKYALYINSFILKKLEDNGIMLKKLVNNQGYYGTFYAPDSNRAEIVLYRKLYFDLTKLGMTRDFIQTDKNKKLFITYIKNSNKNKNEVKETIRKIKRRMLEDGVKFLEVKRPGKKNKKIPPMPLEMLFGVKIEENGVSILIPLLILENKVNDSSKKNQRIVKFFEEYSKGRKLDDVIKSN